MRCDMSASPQDTKEHDNVEIYTADAFTNQNNQLFSAVGFFFIAVMNGGDYNVFRLILIPMSIDPV